MAIDAAVYSPHEWRVGVAAETTTGTAKGTSDTFQALDVADLVIPDQSIIQTLDQRNGTGRTFKTADHFVTDKGSQPITAQVTGVYDKTVGKILIENICTTAAGTGPASVSVAAQTYTPPELSNGGSNTGNTGTLTLAIVSPETGETIYLGGCVVTELTLTADGGTDGGRWTYQATFETRFRPADASNAPTLTAPATTYHYLREMTTVKTLGGADVVLNKVVLALKNPLITAGYTGSNGDPETLSRAIPNIEAGLTLGIKYDANTATLWQLRRQGTERAVELADNATWASATCGVKMAAGAIVSNAQPSGTDQGAFIDLELKATGGSSGDLFEVII